jgi:hypothetical protein
MKHDLGIVAAYKWSQRNSFAAWITFVRLRIGREGQRKVIVLSKAPGTVCQWSVERSSVVMCWLVMDADERDRLGSDSSTEGSLRRRARRGAAKSAMST